MTKVLAITPDKQLRLRAVGKAKGVVEVKSGENSWTWAIYRSLPISRAWELFNNQAKFHQAVEE